MASGTKSLCRKKEVGVDVVVGGGNLDAIIEQRIK